MLKAGLVSVTFRQLTPREIVALAAKAGLDAIEWGGDIHVPPGALSTAREVRELTTDSGLQISSYGSYYRAGESGDFDSVLATARELEAPLIRVWAGARSWKESDPNYKRRVLDDLARIAALAKPQGRAISMEFHQGTLNDAAEPSLEILRSLAGSGVLTHWQPPAGEDGATCAASLSAVLPSLAALHVFHWLKCADGQIERRPFGEGAKEWSQYLKLASADGQDRCALLEFVKDDSPEQLLQDAAALKTLLG